MPVSFTTIMAPVVLLRTIPPVSGVGGASLTIIMFCSVVWMQTFWPGGMGGGTSASVGTSANMPQKPPTQIGLSGSPPSNSIQTPAPICGTAKKPSALPANGTQGMAQLVGTTLDTAGTIAMMRPICSGSMLLTTVPRYLP